MPRVFKLKNTLVALIMLAMAGYCKRYAARDDSEGAATPQLFSRFDSRATHARTLLPAVLASMPFGFVVARVRVRTLMHTDCAQIFVLCVHIMNTASKLVPHTQTDRGTCPGLGLWVYYKSRYATWGFKRIIAQPLCSGPQLSCCLRPRLPRSTF
jgi:hypothetical protein